MRQAISIVFIVLISMQNFYRAGLITYFEANREYIATVLCINKEEPVRRCNGQCFLKKNLQKAEEPVSATSSIRDKVPAFEYVAEESLTLDHQPVAFFKSFTLYSHKLRQGIYIKVFRPPVTHLS